MTNMASMANIAKSDMKVENIDMVNITSMAKVYKIVIELLQTWQR